jgi:putative hydrolase of the HAD superfamily
MEAVTRRYDAVVFDLFGTLVPEFSRTDFFQAVRAAADRLGCDREAFEREWSRTAMLRQTGAYPGGMEENARAIVASLGGAEPTAHAVAEALAPRDELYDRWFHPRDGALETLREVKTRGYPVALVSMCAPDTPERWRASDMAPFVDVTVFSSETGLRKPNAEIYLAACDGLGVEPDRCVYLRRRCVRRALRRGGGGDDRLPDPAAGPGRGRCADARTRGGLAWSLDRRPAGAARPPARSDGIAWTDREPRYTLSAFARP